LDSQDATKLPDGIQPTDWFFGSEDATAIPELLLGENLKSVTEPLKLLGLVNCPRWTSVFVQRKLTIADHKIPRVSQRERVDFPTEVTY
jgi:hypothetical protein